MPQNYKAHSMHHRPKAGESPAQNMPLGRRALHKRLSRQQALFAAAITPRYTFPSHTTAPRAKKSCRNVLTSTSIHDDAKTRCDAWYCGVSVAQGKFHIAAVSRALAQAPACASACARKTCE